MKGAFEIALGGEQVWLLPERAAWLPQHHALLVADVHLGKERVFRRQGIAIPDGPSSADLLKLENLCRSLNARALWILGDLIHGRLGVTLLDQITRWSAALAPVRIHLVEGNHDRHDIARLRASPFGNSNSARLGALTLIHHNEPAQDLGYTVAGHVHPYARVSMGRHKNLRVPSFVLSGRQLTLPAFGEFTGGVLIPPARDQLLFAVLGGEVVRLG